MAQAMRYGDKTGISRRPPTYHDKVEQSMKKWIDESTMIRVFIAGKTGTGKSTLVNELVGREVAKVGDTLNPQTSRVERHGTKVKNIKVEIWDSPGLEDETGLEEEYLKNIADNAVNKDLYLFCISMSRTRIARNSPEIKAMKEMTEKVGPHFWDHTIIVLTFANKVVEKAEYEVDEINDESIRSYFNTQLKEWQTTIRKYLKETVQLSDDIIESVKILPAGDSEMQKLPDPECTGAKWISKLWLECLFVTRVNAQPALMILNGFRLVYNDLETGHDRDHEDELYVQQTLFKNIPIMLKKRGEHYGAEYGRSAVEHGKQMGDEMAEVIVLDFLIMLGLKELHSVLLGMFSNFK